MDDNELHSVGQNLNLEDKDDKNSVFTTEKLKKFNEINGYEDGPALAGEDEENEEEELRDEVLSNLHDKEQEQRDEVHSLKSK